MRRRDILAALGGAAIWPVAALSLEAAKHRIAFLALTRTEDADLIRDRLQELSDDGSTFTFDVRSAAGQVEALPEIAADLVRTNPDVIITGFGTATAKAAQAATARIPIVFTNVGDPIGSGVVKSLSRPGANLTGIAGQGAELSAKRLELLRRIVPSIRSVAVLVEPDAPFTRVALPQAETAADALGLRITVCELGEYGDVAENLAAAARSGAGGVLLLETPVLIAQRQPIVETATRLRMPVVSSVREFVDAGALMFYGPDASQIIRRAADLADKILRGARPEDIPVEQPTKFNLVLNLRAAKSLGLTMPETLVAVADEVIE